MAHRLDYYEILGVTRDCHADDIKKAFKLKAKLLRNITQIKQHKMEQRVKMEMPMICSPKTLSDPILRDLYDSTVYDPTSEPKLTIEGDEMFKAFEYAQLYTHNKFVFTEVLPKLEQKYKNDFRFNSGNPCVGQDCKLLNFTDIFIPMEGKPLVVCINHFYVCDDTCTTSNTQCSLYAECQLCKDWLSKNMKKVPDAHKCFATKCEFTQLKDSIFVCSSSGTPHVCTETQCIYKKPVVKKGVYIITCTATMREFGEDLDPTLHEATKSKEDILEAFNLSSRSRKLTYKDANGKDVEVIVDVPWGVKEIEDEEEWEPVHLIQGSSAKRAREDDNESEEREGEKLVSKKRKGKTSKKEYKRGGKGESHKGIYNDVELGPYGMDGGANLDFRSHDEAYDNLGDYATMRGQIGDEDDIIEEFAEDAEHEFDRDAAVMDAWVERVTKSNKQLEAKKTQLSIQNKDPANP